MSKAQASKAMRLISSFLPWKKTNNKKSMWHCLNTVCSDNWGKLTMFILSLFPLLVWSGKTTTARSQIVYCLSQEMDCYGFCLLNLLSAIFPHTQQHIFTRLQRLCIERLWLKYTSQTSGPIQLGAFIWPGIMFLLKSKKEGLFSSSSLC